uniref:HTH OST-type domain-containing protein n=1 Tax=Strongyloides venezuelensis TaxID=75913 RepID=A0A0K0G0N6_STRVS
MEDNLKHRSLDDTNSKDRQPSVIIERKDSQTGMKKNDYGNRRYTKNLNGIYYNTGNTRYYKNRFSYKGNHKQGNGQMNRYNNYHGDFSSGQFNHRHSFNGYNNRNSHSLRNPSQSHDLYTNERNPRSRINSDNSHSSRDFTPSLQQNNIQFTNLPNQVQNYSKNEKNESVQSLPNLNNINPSAIMRSSTNYVMPDTNKMCVCCSLNAKRKIAPHLWRDVDIIVILYPSIRSDKFLLQTTIVQLSSTIAPRNHFDNRNDGSDSGMHTNSTSSASSNDGDPKRLESLSNVPIQESVSGRVGVNFKPPNRLGKWNRTPKNCYSKRQPGYSNNRRNKYSYNITPVQQFYADLPVSEDLKYQLLNGFRHDSNNPHCHLGLPPLPIQPPLFYHYQEIIGEAKEMYNNVIEHYSISDSKILDIFYKHIVDENPLLHYYPNKKYFTCLDTSHFYKVENYNQPCYFYEGNPPNQYNIPPPKIEEKTIYQYNDDKCLNYPKILKKEKNISNFEEDNLKEQHLAKSLPMVMSYKEAVQSTNDFEIPQTDIQGNIGIPNNIVHTDQYFFQQTPINGFITPNPLLQNFNNSQYPLPMNLPNYQSSSQLPLCCNTVPHQYTYVQECDPHNNKNAAVIQSLCFMFLEDCKSIDKGRPAVAGKRQQQTVCNNKRGFFLISDWRLFAPIIFEKSCVIITLINYNSMYNSEYFSVSYSKQYSTLLHGRIISSKAILKTSSRKLVANLCRKTFFVKSVALTRFFIAARSDRINQFTKKRNRFIE